MTMRGEGRDGIAADGGPAEPGYAAWKRAKVERGLAQSRDRTAMIPIEQVWRELLAGR